MVDLEIDGSYGSGGGAILRIATALSSITGKSIKIYDIRKKKSNPGLRTQHLKGIQAVAKLCNARVKNAKLNSTEIEFYPKDLEPKDLRVKVKTAGSIGLIFQTLQIPCSQTRENIEIKIDGGATYGKWAPTIGYVKNILFSFLKKIGYEPNIQIIREGFYPKGGAKVNFKVFPWEPKPLNLIKQGEIESISGTSISSKSLKKAEVSKRQAEKAKKVLKDYFGINPNINYSYTSTDCPGSGIVLWIKTNKTVIGYDVIGEKGIPSEKIGKKAARGLINQWKSKAPIDEFMSDQILPFLALAKEKSKIKVAKLTDHCLTNIWLIEKFLSTKFITEGRKKRPETIKVIPQS